MNFLVLIVFPLVSASLTAHEVLTRRIARLSSHIENHRNKIRSSQHEVALLHNFSMDLGCQFFVSNGGPLPVFQNVDRMYAEIMNPQVLQMWPTFSVGKKFAYCEAIRAKLALSTHLRDVSVEWFHRLVLVKGSYEWRIDARSEDSLSEPLLSFARAFEEHEIRFDKVHSEIQEFFDDEERKICDSKIFWDIKDTRNVLKSLIHETVFENEDTQKLRLSLEMLLASRQMTLVDIYILAKSVFDEFQQSRFAAASDLLRTEIELHGRV